MNQHVVPVQGYLTLLLIDDEMIHDEMNKINEMDENLFRKAEWFIVLSSPYKLTMEKRHITTHHNYYGRIAYMEIEGNYGFTMTVDDEVFNDIDLLRGEAVGAWLKITRELKKCDIYRVDSWDIVNLRW